MSFQLVKNLAYFIFPLQLFFASYPYFRRSSSPIRLVLDWDGTLTKRDTLHIVAAIGYDHNRDLNLTPWNEIVQAYVSDYVDYEARYKPAAKDRKTIAEESEWLASLKDVERRSLERVEEAGIFTGVTKQEVSLASKSAIHHKKVELRHGWRELLSIACETDKRMPEVPPVSIISVNWSSTFIRACLETTLAETPTNKSIMDSIPIFANEIYPDSEEALNIRTSADKLAAFQKLRETDNRPIVYVGDSSTDFDCLIAADVGICVRDDPMGSGQKELKETLERVGLEVLRLSPAAWVKHEEGIRNEGDGQGRESKKKVWWVTDLMEVVRFIEGGQ
jgi:2-hydroxy-3-keto-5-methylthiopentenyl-1-phosphate phosphatase